MIPIEAPQDDLAGIPVVPAGDVDGDGRIDLLIGATGWGESASGTSTFQGAAYLVLGSAL